MNRIVNMIYISLSGNTERMLAAAAEGVRDAGGEAHLIKATESRGMADVIECDAMVWGTGNYLGYMEGLLKHWFDLYEMPLKELAKKGKLAWKPYFACCSAGAGGAKPLKVIDYLSWSMNLKKVFEHELAWYEPESVVLAACRDKGRQLVEVDMDRVPNLYQPTPRQLSYVTPRSLPDSQKVTD